MNCKRRSSSLVCWSDLPDHIWHFIAKKLLTIQDQICFRSVCKKWRSLLTFPQPPWLMLPEDNNTPNIRKFFGLGDPRGDVENHTKQEFHQFELPEAYKTRCVGSSGTWIITIDGNERICMLNPFTRRQIDLPVQSEFEEGFAYEEYEESELTHEELRDGMLRKVVISPRSLSSGWVAMAIYFIVPKLAIARQGEASWTNVDSPRDFIDDVIFNDDGFWAVTGGMHMLHGTISSQRPKVTHVTHFSEERTGLERNYLVKWLDKVLLVTKINNEDSKLIKFKVYQFDQSAEKKWKECKSLGSYSLFVGGFNTSVAVLASRFPGLKNNCIYFSDDYIYQDDGWLISGKGDMGFFDMEDGSIQLIYEGVSTPLHSPPIWIIPMS